MKGIWTFLIACLFCVNILTAQTVYFLVSSSEACFGESYVVPISDPTGIAHARNLIEQGPSIGDSIIVARIACGTDNINRNYNAPGKLRWRWHVTEFLNFADLTAEILDGCPSFVDDDCNAWVESTGGLIGFWTYTIVAELGTDPDIFQCNFDHQGDTMNLADFQIIAEHWLRTDCLTSNCKGADTDHDGTVNLADLDYCLDFWLEGPLPPPYFFPEWDCATQCHGDADCYTERIFPNRNYPVYNRDLSIYLTASNGPNWPVYYGDINYDPRADFDRDYDVDDDDGDILSTWFEVSEDDFPTDCETAPQ